MKSAFTLASHCCKRTVHHVRWMFSSGHPSPFDSELRPDVYDQMNLRMRTEWHATKPRRSSPRARTAA